MTVHLLDGNVLVALADEAHVHHPAAVGWFASTRSPFATCSGTRVAAGCGQRSSDRRNAPEIR